MTQDEYKHLTAAEMRARRWRVVVAIQTRNLVIPVGSEVEVVGKSGGLTVASSVCATCGVSVFARRVPPMYVEEIR